jgi:uncharacterized protein
MYKKLSILILILAAGITGFAIFRITKIGFDYNFEHFFPRKDKDTEFFNEHRNRFGSDNDFILIGIKNEEGVFKKDFLNKLKLLTDSLQKVTNVKEILSPVNIKETVRDPLIGMFSEIPFLRYNQPERYAKDSVRIYQTPELVGNIFSKDGKSVCLIISHTEKIQDQECKDISKRVQSILGSFDFDEFHLAGRSISQAYYSSIMRIDLILLLVAAFVVILVVMIIIYRNAIGILLPTGMVALVVIWTLGIMELMGKDMDVLANAIPTILVVTGLSVAVHFVTKYLDLVRDGSLKLPALKATISQVGRANLLATITTVVGFATLPTSGIKPIDDFGIYTSIGVILSLLIGYTVLPAILNLLPTPTKFRKKKPKITWSHSLTRLFNWVIGHKIIVVSMFSALIIAMSIGTSLVKENTFLLDDLSKKSPIKKDFNYFEQTFQGTRPFEMAVWLKDPNKSIFDKDVILGIEQLESYLHKEYGIGYILSPIALIKGSNRSMAGGDPNNYLIPESDSRLTKITNELMAIKTSALVKGVVTPDFKMCRLRAIIPDIGSRKANHLNKNLKNYMESTPQMHPFNYHLTGTAELIDKNNRSLIANMAISVGIALLAVCIIFLILFKSWRMIIIGLIPNLIPLIFISGLMGYFGISMKMSTAILFSVTLGIAVDDTVHFLSKLRMETKSQPSVLDALRATYLSTGKPMIIMTMLLCLGFAVLALSSFKALQTIGIVVSLALLIGMINEILLMPVLIMLIYKDKKIPKLPPTQPKQ